MDIDKVNKYIQGYEFIIGGLVERMTFNENEEWLGLLGAMLNKSGQLTALLEEELEINNFIEMNIKLLRKEYELSLKGLN